MNSAARLVSFSTLQIAVPALVAILTQLGRFYLIADRHEAAEKILARINGLIGERQKALAK
jgi:hypothetical protein